MMGKLVLSGHPMDWGHACCAAGQVEKQQLTLCTWVAGQLVGERLGLLLSSISNEPPELLLPHVNTVLCRDPQEPRVMMHVPSILT